MSPSNFQLNPAQIGGITHDPSELSFESERPHRSRMITFLPSYISRLASLTYESHPLIEACKPIENCIVSGNAQSVHYDDRVLRHADSNDSERFARRECETEGLFTNQRCARMRLVSMPRTSRNFGPNELLSLSRRDLGLCPLLSSDFW